MSSIFVTTYAKYNNGEQFAPNGGKWFDLTDYESEQELKADLIEYHKDENEPELMVTDTDDLPDIFYNESYNPKLLEQAIQISNDGRITDLNLFCDYIKQNGLQLEDIADYIDDFQSDYLGEYDSLSEVTKEYYENIYGDLTETLNSIGLSTADINWKYTDTAKFSIYEIGNGHFFQTC